MPASSRAAATRPWAPSRSARSSARSIVSSPIGRPTRVWPGRRSPPSRRPQSITDASLCQQIFGNLISNALKYTPRGGRITVEGTVEDDHWRLAVIDDGPGIPADSLDKVFEPFYRLPRDEHSRIEGNGLGLAICRELTERLGGAISLESSPGGGTTALVRLPRHRPVCDERGPRAKAVARRQRKPASEPLAPSVLTSRPWPRFDDR